MIRTDQKGKWQLRAECIFRFRTKKEMDAFAFGNCVRLIEVLEFKKGNPYARRIDAFNKSIVLGA